MLFLGLCLRGRIAGLKRRTDDWEFDDDDYDTTCFFHCIASDMAFLGVFVFPGLGKGYDRQRTARSMARWLHVHFR